MAHGHAHILLPYQKRWVDDPAPMKIWLAARQIGKSFAISMEAVMMALGSGRCTNLILSSSDRQSREVMQKVYSHLRFFDVRTRGIVSAEAESKSEVALPNGSRIISLPANPSTVRGFSGNVFLDEFAFHRDGREIWRAMYPTVSRGYKVRVTSTPNGKQNMFYDLWESAPANGISRHRTTVYEAVAEGLRVDIARLKAGMGDPEAWAQEFECEFIDEATALLTFELIGAAESAEATQTLDMSALGPEAELYIGVDIGRRHDLTVIWLVERSGLHLVTRAVITLRGTTFSSQRDALYALMDIGRMRRGCIDATGIGAQLAEEARERYGQRVEPVTFTPPVKEDLAVTARRAFEDRTIRIPSSPEIRTDLHAVRRSVSPAGNARFEADSSEAGHADRFWALALHAASRAKTAAASYERIKTLSLAPSSGGRGCW